LLNKFQKGNSRIDPSIIQLTLFVWIIAGLAIYFKPAILGFNMAVKSPAPESTEFRRSEYVSQENFKQTAPL
jgi:hypothetical protein